MYSINIINSIFKTLSDNFLRILDPIIPPIIPVNIMLSNKYIVVRLIEKPLMRKLLRK